MRKDLFLIVNRRGKVRVNIETPALDADEISIKLRLELPDALFQKTTLEGTIIVPAESVSRPKIEIPSTDAIAEAIKSSTGIEAKITFVHQSETT